MLDALLRDGNASSVHAEGRQSRKTIEDARRQVAALVGAKPANVIFMSGASEAAMHALSPTMRALGKALYCSKLFVAATEHPCVLEGGRFSPENIIKLPVLENGLVDAIALRDLLSKHDDVHGVPLVAIMLANNETGVIQPIGEIAEIVHGAGGFLLVDAVQAAGRVSVSMEALGADFLFLSSHKLGGPKGAGALVLRDAGLSPIPLITGGGQENFHRAGTQNTAAIAGFGAACLWHLENVTEKVQISHLRDSMERQLVLISKKSGNVVSTPVFFGATAERLPNTSCFAVKEVSAETALVALDLEGVAVSSGSACSSGKLRRSHVLEAMGAGEAEMGAALRVSLGTTTTERDTQRFLNAWERIISRRAA